jgi:hypothetical protein
MQYPPDYLAEVGNTAANGSTAAAQLPPTCDLSNAAPSEQEAALVADLLGVFMGQVGQYVVHAMVEGPKWQRLGLQVKGVTEPSLVEQVSKGLQHLQHTTRVTVCMLRGQHMRCEGDNMSW